MKFKWLWLLCILMLMIAGPAYAVQTIDSGFGFYIGAGESLMPDYPDLAYLIGDGLTKDDFTVSFASNGTRHFSEDGRVTIDSSFTRPSSFLFEMTYIPKVPGVGKETIFTGYVYVREPLTEITVLTESVTVALDETATARISQPSGTVPIIGLGDYDSSIIDATIAQESWNTRYWSISITPKMKGETVIEVVAYNGLTVEIPVTVVDPPSKLTFAQETFSCYVGETIDLGADLGGGGMFSEPDITVRRNSSYTSSSYLFPNDWQHFYAESTGSYYITMKTYNGLQASVRVNVYNNVNCERIALSSEAPNVGDQYLYIYAYDAEGNKIACPIDVTQGADIAYIENDLLRTTAEGVVELTATNPDGSKVVFSVRICERPSQIILNQTSVTLDIGERFDLTVAFDKGDSDYSLTLRSDTVSPDFMLYPVRMEGQTFIAQAPGVSRVTVYAGYLQQECVITVRDSAKALRMLCPEEPFGVGHTFRMKVVDRTGREYPAVFTAEKLTSDTAADVTPDGLVTGLYAGRIRIIASLEDGRRLQYDLWVKKVPSWIRHPILVCRLNSTLVRLSTIESDVGTISTTDVTLSIADESIATYSGLEFTPHAVGTTEVTLTAVNGGATTTFTLTVLDADDQLYAGATTLNIPVGYFTFLPAVTDYEGNIIPLSWEITYQVPGLGNPYDEGFLLEEDAILCLWPYAYCEVTGTAASGAWIRVGVYGYRLPESISFQRSQQHLSVGQTVFTDLAAIEQGFSAGPVSWYVSDPEVIDFTPPETSDSRPKVRALKNGAATLTAELVNGVYATTLIMVSDGSALTLPSALTAIESEAFLNSTCNAVFCPSGLKSIGAGAFKGCTQLQIVSLPASVTTIADNAFSGCTQLTICCPADSPAQTYAENHNIPYVCY